MTSFLDKYRLRRQNQVHRRDRRPKDAEAFSPRFRVWFYAASYLSAYSGFLLMFFFGKSADFFPLWKQVLVKTHIFAVVLWLFLCGMLFSVHVFPQLRLKITKGKKSGLGLIALLVAMTFTGYGIQILPTPLGIDLSRYGHIVTGVAFSFLFVAHLALVRPRLRLALASATILSLLIAAPFFFLKSESQFPDEIKLAPLSLDADSAAAKKK